MGRKRCLDAHACFVHVRCVLCLPFRFVCFKKWGPFCVTFCDPCLGILLAFLTNLYLLIVYSCQGETLGPYPSYVQNGSKVLALPEGWGPTIFLLQSIGTVRGPFFFFFCWTYLKSPSRFPLTNWHHNGRCAFGFVSESIPKLRNGVGFWFCFHLPFLFEQPIVP